MKLLLLAALVGIAAADPGYYGGQYSWPSVRGYGFSSTCWGCRPGGYRYKRDADADADADAEPGYGYGGYGFGGYGYGGLGYGYGGYGRGIAGHYGGGRSYTHRSPQGLGKRSADEEPAPVEDAAEIKAYAQHPTGKSFVGRTIWGFPPTHSVEKRSADAEPGYGYGGYGYGGYGYGGYGGRYGGYGGYGGRYGGYGGRHGYGYYG